MWFLQLNRKLFKIRFNDRKGVITFVVIVFLGKSSSDVFTAFIPSEFGIFVYKDFTSSDTRYELSGFYCLKFTHEVTSIFNIWWNLFDNWLKIIISIFWNFGCMTSYRTYNWYSWVSLFVYLRLCIKWGVFRRVYFECFYDICAE